MKEHIVETAPVGEDYYWKEVLRTDDNDEAREWAREATAEGLKARIRKRDVEGKLFTWGWFFPKEEEK